MIEASNEALETAQRVKASMWARDRTAQALGMTIEAVGVGTSRVRMIVREEMLNGHDSCHGGMIFSLADTAFAYACNSHNPINVAQQCSISFLARAVRGDELAAVAQERHRGKRSGLYDVTVSKADGTVVALFRGTSAQLQGLNVE